MLATVNPEAEESVRRQLAFCMGSENAGRKIYSYVNNRSEELRTSTDYENLGRYLNSELELAFQLLSIADSMSYPYTGYTN
jgi:hypothetical protein